MAVDRPRPVVVANMCRRSSYAEQDIDRAAKTCRSIEECYVCR
jgi:hypothetical protein